MSKYIVITIDGPAASGKSTIAQLLAQKLDFYYVSTGMLYRALAYSLIHSCKLSLPQLAEPPLNDVQYCLGNERIQYDYDPQTGTIKLFFEQKDITPYLKSETIDQGSSLVSANGMVRYELLSFQRSFAREHNVVVEGRDIGSVVFPNAQIKFFLTASPEVRAERWQHDQKKRGNEVSYEQSLSAINERDKRDTEREISPLIVPQGAIVIDNSAMSFEETIEKMMGYIKKMKGRN